MKFCLFAATTLLGVALVSPNPASAWGGCRCMMMNAPGSGCMPGMSMPMSGGRNQAGHGNHKPAPLSPRHDEDRASATKTTQVMIAVSGMTWPVNCPPRVRKALASLPWVRKVLVVDYDEKLAVVTVEASRYDEKALLGAVEKAGYGGKVLK